MEVIVGFVDDHRDDLGVESICAALQIAPSTYDAARRRQSEPSARARRDAALVQVLMVLWVANRKVYGAHNSGSQHGQDVLTLGLAELVRRLGRGAGGPSLGGCRRR